MKVTGMNRTTVQRNLLRIYSIDKKENGICLQICSNKTEEKIEESQKKGDSDMAEFDYEVVNGSEVKVYELPSDVIKGAIATDAEVEEMLAEVIPTV